MTLTLTQFLEAAFIAIMVIFLTNPHLLATLNRGQELMNIFHLF